MSEYFDNSNILKIVQKYQKQLLIVSVASLVLSVIFSAPWFIKPKYKSTAVLYPANIIAFGSETPDEQMVQVFQSDDIKTQIANEFNLYETYGIDTTKVKSYKTKLIKEFNENITIDKTELVSVRLEALHPNPVVARDIVSRMIELFNQKERALQKEKAMELVTILKKQLDNKRNEMDSMDVLVRDIRVKYGILDYALQTEYATEGALISNSMQKANEQEVKTMLKNLQDKGGEFVALNEHLWRIRGTYNDLKVQYENALRDVEKNLTYCNVVTSPFVADKKSYPVRWLIVVISTLSTLMFSLIVISVIENYNSSKN
ncbi:MAG: hypothetical protein POELPBGB_00549 [Bacteroidia bacterium]|nr:hypothetical protein [Bacteroidia bacterium]